MQIIDLYIAGFGKFHNKHISFASSLNIINGNNETGKSTIHSFLKAMFYGLERARGRAGKNDDWTKFEPWINKANYGGYIRVKKDDIIYRIERDFSKNASNALVVVNETLGKKEDCIPDTLLNNISRTAYSNTISISQLKAKTDDKMADELRNYIANMNNAGNDTLDITRALDYLKAQKKSLSSNLVDEAAKVYDSNVLEIQTLEDDIDKFNSLGDIKEVSKLKEEYIAKKERKRIELENIKNKVSISSKYIEEIDMESAEEAIKLKEEFLKLYSEYIDYKSAKKARWLNTLFFILLIAAFVSGGVALYMYLNGSKNIISSRVPVQYDFALAITAWVMALSVVGLTVCSRFLNAIRQKENFLKDKILIIISMVTGKKALNEENIILTRQKLLKAEDVANELKVDRVQIENLEKEIKDFEQEYSEYFIKLEKEEKNIWELEKKIEKLSNLRDENIALKKQIAENERIEGEISAINLAMDTLLRISANIKDSFGFYLNEEASNLIDSITKGLYNSISIDKNLKVYVNTKDKLIPIESLSSGTIDQIYLAIRLAVVKLLQKDSLEVLPLILDDSFVNYDKYRLGHALEFLINNYKGQILLFSCHDREKNMLEHMNAKFELINL